MIICYREVIVHQTIPTNFNHKNVTCKTQSLYNLLAFFLITITLLIVVSTYCYLIKYRVKKNIYYHFMIKNFKNYFLVV